MEGQGFLLAACCNNLVIQGYMGLYKHMGLYGGKKGMMEKEDGSYNLAWHTMASKFLSIPSSPKNSQTFASKIPPADM